MVCFMSEGLSTNTILDIYSRLRHALKSRKVVLEGGAAIKLLVKSSRLVSDIDASTDMPYVDFKRKFKELGLVGFKFVPASIVLFTDNKTKAELDFGYRKEFGPSNGYLGLTHKDIVSKAVAKNFNYKGEKVRVFIMTPEHLLDRKLKLMMLPGRSELKRKRDKEDIISILDRFY